MEQYRQECREPRPTGSLHSPLWEAQPMALETGKHPGELKDMVCSPGGTTIEAVQVLEDRGFRSSVMHAVSACVERCRALSKDET